jgi:hypothetical protein
MRRAFDNALLSAGAAVILVLVLVALDPNVRAQVWRQAGTSVHLADASQQASHFAHILWAAVRDQSFANAPMLIFGVAAAVLVMFMLRT